MAQLPPKVPNVMHNDYHNQQWEGFLQQAQNPSTPWVDEFMEFSAIRRGTHRRTMSDSSVAFLEAGPPVPCVSGCGSFRLPEVNDGCKTNDDDQYDQFDDEQLIMSMFGSELGRSHSNPSSTSDHNSTNEVLMTMTTTTTKEDEKEEEIESPSKSKKAKGKGQGQGQGAGEESHSKGGNVAAEVDPKRVKRILANRQSAQRSRVRKLQYISELERSVTALQSEVSALSPRVAFLDHQRMILNGDNSTLKAKIAALAQDKIFKDAHQEAMKREIERLRQVYYQQNISNTENIIRPPSSSSLQQINPSQQPDNTVHENKQLNG